ncbi:hypothetical protein [Nocardia sp. XZ_19_385]|uniref:hypothetical protein n=1 Tax=Nocardia sp. XZ_19_385 TaxID=2769488 RepID=UPI00188E54EA|nr:hypothetical protein [Nocardia sp. XZ_19_385]
MDRLSVVDEIFLRTHRGLGTPIALQGLWRTADRVEPTMLEQVHRALSAGQLGRRVIRARVPGARRAWQSTRRAHPLDYASSPIPVAGLLNWADAQGDDLDPEFGPGWRLSAVPLDDGGTVVSLTCSHALADGRGLVHAADAALASPEATVDSPSRGSDWLDARRQWSIVIRGTARALRRGIPERSATLDPGRTLTADPRSAILRCPTSEWDRIAAEQGGTANSLFIWLVANLLWNSGFPRDELEASLPVDTRDEPRADNDLAMTSISITRTDNPATIREKARAAYEHRMSSPGGMPEEILQVIPDRWAHTLTRGAGERDILCSNIGPLPATLDTLGPHKCTGVAARAIHPGLQHLPRTRLSGYLCRIGDYYTLSLVSLDPAIGSASALGELIDAFADTVRIPLSHWSSPGF